MGMARYGRRVWWLAMLVAMVAIRSEQATAQPLDPMGAVSGAAARLAEQGYVIRFARDGGELIRGEVAFGSPVAYRLRVEPDQRSGFEYVVREFTLFTRVLGPDGKPPQPWEQRRWHPDVPIDAGAAYHPRVPLELLRGAANLRAVATEVRDGQGLHRIDADVSLAAAIIASAEDTPSRDDAVQSLIRERWPLSIWLTADGALAAMELTIPAENVLRAAEGAIRYQVLPADTPRLLDPPDDASEAESGVVLREPPPGEVVSPPFAVAATASTLVTPVFRLESGALVLSVSAITPTTSYRLWRLKRGYLLGAGFGTVSGTGSGLRLPLELPPGEYLIEVTFTSEIAATLTISEGSP